MYIFSINTFFFSIYNARSFVCLFFLLRSVSSSGQPIGQLNGSEIQDNNNHDDDDDDDSICILREREGTRAALGQKKERNPLSLCRPFIDSKNPDPVHHWHLCNYENDGCDGANNPAHGARTRGQQY